MPLDDLVLRPPNGPKLIAFLKTMEFTTLTRRVAEATGADACRDRARLPVAVETRRRCARPGYGRGRASRSPPAELPGDIAGGRAVAPAGRGRPGRGRGSRHLAAACRSARQGRARRKIRPRRLCLHPRSADARRLDRGARETGIVAFDTETTSLDPMQAELVGFSLATAPAAAPPMCRSPTRRARAICSAAAGRGPDPDREALAAAEAAAGGPLGPQGRRRTSNTTTSC